MFRNAKAPVPENYTIQQNMSINGTFYLEDVNVIPPRQPKGIIPDPNSSAYVFWMIETVCICWFCLELFLRFASSPNKGMFWRDIMNLIDIIAIVPYFVPIIMYWAKSAEDALLEEEDDNEQMNMIAAAVECSPVSPTSLREKQVVAKRAGLLQSCARAA